MNRLISVPEGATILILPITDNPTDTGSAIIDHAEALHRATELLDNGEDG